MSNTVRVRLPNGQVLRARLNDKTENGFRKAYVRVGSGVDQTSISGRVPARHGFTDGRVLPFQVKADGTNSRLAFEGTDTYVG